METEKPQSRDRLERQAKAGEWAQRLVDSTDYGNLVAEMDKEIMRLIQLTEDAEFIKQASENPMVLADNLSFRRGIRYAIDYPRRLLSAAERARTKLAEWDTLEEAETGSTDTV